MKLSISYKYILIFTILLNSCTLQNPNNLDNKDNKAQNNTDKNNSSNTNPKLLNNSTASSVSSTETNNSKTNIDNSKTNIDNSKTNIDNSKTNIDNSKTNIDNSKTNIDNRKTIINNNFVVNNIIDDNKTNSSTNKINPQNKIFIDETKQNTMNKYLKNNFLANQFQLDLGISTVSTITYNKKEYNDYYAIPIETQNIIPEVIFRPRRILLNMSKLKFLLGVESETKVKSSKPLIDTMIENKKIKPSSNLPMITQMINFILISQNENFSVMNTITRVGVGYMIGPVFKIPVQEGGAQYEKKSQVEALVLQVGTQFYIPNNRFFIETTLSIENITNIKLKSSNGNISYSANNLSYYYKHADYYDNDNNNDDNDKSRKRESEEERKRVIEERQREREREREREELERRIEREKNENRILKEKLAREQYKNESKKKLYTPRISIGIRIGYTF